MKNYRCIEQAVLHAPPHITLNPPGGSVIGKHHERLWTILMDIMRESFGRKFPRTEQKIKGLWRYGTILFLKTWM